MTSKQRAAIDLMRCARQAEPATDDGLAYGGATFYDREIHVAFVNIQTARALKDRGLLTFSHFDPEWGTSLTLTEAGWHD